MEAKNGGNVIEAKTEKTEEKTYTLQMTLKEYDNFTTAFSKLSSLLHTMHNSIYGDVDPSHFGWLFMYANDEMDILKKAIDSMDRREEREFASH